MFSESTLRNAESNLKKELFSADYLGGFNPCSNSVVPMNSLLFVASLKRYMRSFTVSFTTRSGKVDVQLNELRTGSNWTRRYLLT